MHGLLKKIDKLDTHPLSFFLAHQKMISEQEQLHFAIWKNITTTVARGDTLTEHLALARCALQCAIDKPDLDMYVDHIRIIINDLEIAMREARLRSVADISSMGKEKVFIALKNMVLDNEITMANAQTGWESYFDGDPFFLSLFHEKCPDYFDNWIKRFVRKY